MNSVIGNKITYSLFGESHGEEMGIVINGLPEGIKIDFDYINEELFRRRPKKDGTTTSRIEADEYRIVSGIFNGFTTGSPLTAIIKNQDRKSSDYDILREVMRPGHADYTSRVKYRGFNDHRGSGHFSGRLTAPLVICGAIAKQILKEKGINFYTRIKSIGDITDDIKPDYAEFEVEKLELLREKELSGKLALFSDIEDEIRNLVLKTADKKDSLGGSIECVITGIPAGFGNPFFYSVESVISHYMFSVPAVKAIEFGDGIEMSRKNGSYSNDEFTLEEGMVKTVTNHSGGINGGITNGMPVFFTCFIKPTSSIGISQNTINIKDMKNTSLEVSGRHDPCIALRMSPVIEAAAAMAILDIIGR